MWRIPYLPLVLAYAVVVLVAVPRLVTGGPAGGAAGKVLWQPAQDAAAEADGLGRGRAAGDDGQGQQKGGRKRGGAHGDLRGK